MAKSPIDIAKNIALNALDMAASSELAAPEGGIQHILIGVYEIPLSSARVILLQTAAAP
jgi:hypothetical protein